MNSTRFVRNSGIFLCLVTLFFVTGCANRGGSYAGSSSGSNVETRRGQTMDVALEEMGTCLKSTPKGSKANCANQLYSRINSGLSDSEPDKAPSLTAVTKMHTLFSKFDRSEITSPQDMQNGMRQIFNELKIDIQRARHYSAAQQEMESRRQRQLFQEAQRLLAPTNSNVLTCRPAPGYAPGTSVCQ